MRTGKEHPKRWTDTGRFMSRKEAAIHVHFRYLTALSAHALTFSLRRRPTMESIARLLNVA